MLATSPEGYDSLAFFLVSESFLDQKPNKITQYNIDASVEA
jgi:hypothetical protein